MDPPDSGVRDGFVSAAQYDELLLKYETLRKAFDEYRREAEERSQKAATKIRSAKESIKKWNEYIEKKLAKQALQLQQQHADQDFATPRAAQAMVEDRDEPLALPNPAVEAARNTSVSASECQGHSRITSSQTTEGEAAARSSSLLPSDDSPVVVSAKTLKRKRESLRKDSQPRKVKNELLSSSPHNSRAFIPTLLRTETSDLDVFRPIQQPRFNPGGHPLSRQSLRHSADRVLEDTASHRSGIFETPTTNRVSKTRSPGNAPADASPKAVSCGDDANESQHSNSTIKSVKTEPGLSISSTSKKGVLSRTANKSAGLQDSRSKGGPLHNISPNTPILPRTSAAPVTSGKKLDHSRGANAVHVLSEDGDNTRHGFKKPRIDDATPKSVGLGRLNQLLEGTSPRIDRTISSPRSAQPTRRPREILEQHASRSVEKPISRITRTVRDRPSPRAAVQKNRNTDMDDESGTVLPEHEPLRSRPLHRLNIDDFRVNPKYSGGLSYAFRESIRKREEKKCLPGCTREECCGAIRRFIAAGGLPADTSITDDDLTLQGYLGSGYAFTIHNSTEEEKQQMLIDARAKAFADRHGKHRQNFERRTTPPGFWRAEMPSTQELEKDREEARIQERQKVEERWRDAIRGGGRYMFRDES